MSGDATTSEGLGGVIFRVSSSGELFFLPATIAMKVLPVPEMAHMPGGPIELRGVALVDGDMIAVLDAGDPIPRSGRSEPASEPAGGAMLVCSFLGEKVGLVGIEVVATGRFDRAGDVAHPSGSSSQDNVVKFDGGEVAKTFDVADIIARVREGRWAV